jgi:hypothetical protein
MTEAESRTIGNLGSLVILMCGVALIAISFMPLSSLAKREWTIADSEALGQVTRELHDATQESSKQSARTAEELARYQANLEREFERLSGKLEHAKQAPERWSYILLWSGAGLTAIGALAYLAKKES